LLVAIGAKRNVTKELRASVEHQHLKWPDLAVLDHTLELRGSGADGS
jgi:hypothetical protein